MAACFWIEAWSDDMPEKQTLMRADNNDELSV